MALRQNVSPFRYTRPMPGLSELTVPCTRLVIASGAWSPRVFNTLFPTSATRIPISALGGHSLLVRNPHFKPNNLDKETCHAVFATDTLGFSPEWFARTGGELYLAGLTSTTTPLPDIATEVNASEKAIEQLKACAMAMMEGVAGKELEVLREGLVGSYSIFDDTYRSPWV
jgi:glycine/D-amino acid oxidase-like deaminating enzyme